MQHPPPETFQRAFDRSEFEDVFESVIKNDNKNLWRDDETEGSKVELALVQSREASGFNGAAISRSPWPGIVDTFEFEGSNDNRFN
jgi:hypothetical protein